MSFFVSVVFLLVPPPSPNPPPNILRHIPVNLASVFQKSSIFTWSQKSNTLHKLPKTSTVFSFGMGPVLPVFSSSKRLQFRILVHYETSQGSHCSEVTCWKCEFAASFWLSWSPLGCTALLCFNESWFLSASHNETWSNQKKQQKNKKNSMFDYGSIQSVKCDGEKINQHVIFQLSCICP